MTTVRGRRRSRIPSGLLSTGLAVAALAIACATPEAPSPSPDPPRILMVGVGEQVQSGPPTEELKMLMFRAEQMAEVNGADLGYPWYDEATGEIVLSAVTQKGSDLIHAAGLAAPHRIRVVAHGMAELERIKDEVTTLRSLGVPGAELVYQTVPDWRDNRVMIVISAPSQPLLDALAARYPPDALAIQVDPAGP
jgi:hypothetical protein